MASLYELNSDFMKIQEMIESGDDGMQDTLESIDLAIEDKIEQTGRVIQNMKAEAEALKNEEKRLADKRKSIEIAIDRLKANIENGLATTGKDKLKTDLFTFAMQNSAPSVKVTDESLLPKRFYVPVDPRLDKTLLKEELKNSDLPGAELVQDRHLRIR